MSFVRASSMTEAADLLAEFGDDAKAIAGGQSLVPMMNLRIAAPTVLVDLSGAAEPSIESDDDCIIVSALTRHCDLERSPVLAEQCPIVAAAARYIGNVRVRNRGTIGGSLAHADPAAELPCVAVALAASVQTESPRGQRVLGASDFFQSVFTTSLEPDELITNIKLPKLGRSCGWSFQEFARRTGDYGISVAAILEFDGNQCRAASLVAGSVADKPLKLVDVEALLVNAEVEAVLDGVEAAAAAAVDEGGHKAAVTGVLARRAVVEAARRASVG
jgi:CO/xanthine dehydrogenase FAD-binding subunit